MNCCFSKLSQWTLKLSLSFATLSRFSWLLKGAINYLDIPSRRARLDKYSQKSTLDHFGLRKMQGSVLEVCLLSFVPVISRTIPRRKLIDSPYCSKFVWFCCPPRLSRPRMTQQQINTTEPEKLYTLYSSCRFFKSFSEGGVGK